MKRRSRLLITGLAASAIGLSCDEGRLVSGIERGPFPVVIATPSGPDTLYVGQSQTYETRVTLDDAAVTSPVIRWSSTPPGVLLHDTTDHGFSLSVLARAPGLATLTARVEDPSLVAEQSSRPIHVLLLGVGPVSPATGDTTLTAIGDVVTLRARGLGVNGATADSAALRWTHHGSALSVAAQPPGLDTLRVEAVGTGTDTLIFEQKDGRCDSGQCVDTITVRVAQAAARLEVTDTVRLSALGASVTPAVSVVDANDHPIPEAVVTWSLAEGADPDVVELGSDGLITALGNGSAAVVARSETAEDTVVAVVRQVPASVAIAPDPAPDTLLAGSSLQLTAAAADSNGAAIGGMATVWTSEDPGVATVSESGQVTGQAVSALDSTRVIATVTPAADTLWVFVQPAILTSVVVSPDSVRITAIGAAAQLTAGALNQGGSPIPGETVTWTTLDAAIATVDASGEVTAVGNGATAIVATSTSDASLADTAIVVVQQEVAVVTVTPGSHTFRSLTETRQFEASATDAMGVPMAEDFDWTDDAGSPGIIAVSATGLVTANLVGTSAVIATAGGVADSAEITVQQLPASISTTPAVDTVAVGATTTLSATVRDSLGSAIPDHPVTWTSLDTALATVDAASGVVTGVAITDSVGIRARPTGHDLVADTTHLVVSAYVLEFDGDDYASAGDVLALGSAWTIEVWVKPASTTGTRYLLTRGGAATANDAAYGLYLDGGKPGVFIRSGPGAGKDVHLPSATTLSTTEWSHVAVSFDGATLQMYINGAPTESAETTDIPRNAAAELLFGASDAAGANGYEGRLDEVRFWGVTRTSPEIAAAYAAPLTGSEPGLLAWWPLREGTGDSADAIAGLLMTLAPAPADPAWFAESVLLP